jgi:glycosyl transferase family 25
VKCYLINLDRSPERLARMASILGEMGVDFERVAAVDGETLSEEQLVAAVSPTSGRRPLSRGEIGCLLSHRLCLERIASGTDAFGLVLEDDIHFSANASSLLKQSNWVPENADLVKIETTSIMDRPAIQISRKRDQINAVHSIARLYSKHEGTAGYIVSKSFARTWAELTFVIKEPFDDIVFDPKCGILLDKKIYQMIPPLCIQDKWMFGSFSSLGSVLDADRLKFSEQTALPEIARGPKVVGLDKLKREAARPFLQLWRWARSAAVPAWDASFGWKTWIRLPFEPGA